MPRRQYFGVTRVLEQLADSDDVLPESDHSENENDQDGVTEQQLINELQDNRVKININMLFIKFDSPKSYYRNLDI